jgi:hypothetical protein
MVSERDKILESISKPMQGTVSRPPPLASKSLFEAGTWAEFFNRVPCVRQSLSIGIGMATLMFAHRFRKDRSPQKAFNWAFSTFSFGSSVNFVFCAQQHNSNKLRQMQLEREDKALARPQTKFNTTPINLRKGPPQ